MGQKIIRELIIGVPWVQNLMRLKLKLSKLTINNF